MPKQVVGPEDHSQSVPPVITFIVIVLTVVCVAFVVNFILKRTFDLSPTSISRTVDDKGSNLASPTPTPKPITPIIKGKETYSVSSSKETKGPLIRSVIVDPHDPSQDETQNFTLLLAPNSHAKSIKIIINLDDKKTLSKELTLSKSSSEGDEWSGSWRLTDTHLYTYGFIIDALDENGNKNHLVISIR